MALGNFLKSIFAGSSQTAKAVEVTCDALQYEGFTIEAAPIDEGGKFRTAGYISGELDGEIKRIRFIRADENSDLQAAIDHSTAKAKQIVDEQGERLLERTQL
ncbi:MAG: hypothetical protein ACI9KN_000902 [Gammaproteobacteria bacterium]|jgi:hypothetical protein